MEFFLVILANSLLALGVGAWGRSRKIGFWPPFVISLFFSAVVGVIVVAVTGAKTELPDNGFSDRLKKAYMDAERFAFKNQWMEAKNAYQDILFDLTNERAVTKEGLAAREKSMERIEAKIALMDERIEEFAMGGAGQ